MFIKSIGIKNFRNLEERKIDCSHPIVVFSGINASGKTSLLESIYSGLFLSSFCTKQLDDVINFGSKKAEICIFIADDAKSEREIRTTIAKNERKIELDGLNIKKRSDLIEVFQAVVLSYNDKNIVTGEPKRRRRFFDQVLSFSNVQYYDLFRKYKAVLKQRNTALRDNHFDLIPFYDSRLTEYGFGVFTKRSEIVKQIEKYVNILYKDLFNTDINFHIEYKTDCRDFVSSDDYLKMLERNFERDCQYLSTSTGVHLDDFVFYFDKNLVSNTASTGQIRLLSIMLRIAEINLLYEKNGKSPVILADDVLLELDKKKKQVIFDYITSTFAQSFWTFTDCEDFYKDRDIKEFGVRNGAVELLTSHQSIAE